MSDTPGAVNVKIIVVRIRGRAELFVISCLEGEGGADCHDHPRISQIRPGSLADRCDLLECGDYLVAVNGTQTANLSHVEIINLLRSAGQHLRLEIKFPLPSAPSYRRTDNQCLQKNTTVTVEKENENFGLTIRGGSRAGDEGRGQFFITRIRPGSPADRDGLFRVGDRITAVDGVSVDGIPQAQLIGLLRRSPLSARFQLQYDVQIIDAVVHANGPLYVEIDRAGARIGRAGRPLGMEIGTSRVGNDRLLIIENIVPASIADRCGALGAGDRILSIDGTPCENMTIPEAVQLLESNHSPTLNMLIVPASVLRKDQQHQQSPSNHPAGLPPPSTSHPKSDSSNTLIRRQVSTESSSAVLHERPLFTSAASSRNESPRPIFAARNDSPPPLPRPPEALYQQVKSPPIERDFNVAARQQPPVITYNDSNHLVVSPSPLLGSLSGSTKKDSDEVSSSDGSLYEKTSSVGDVTDGGLSFLVTIEKRRSEPWGIGFAYRRQDGFADIIVHSLESGGIAQRTEALKVGDIIASINGRPMRNQNLGDAYWQLNSYDIATMKVVRIKKDEQQQQQQLLQHNKPDHKPEARHSPAGSAHSTASVDSAVESWESNLRPQQTSTTYGTMHRPPAPKPLAQSVSAHHLKEVESVSLRIRGSESIPERLDNGSSNHNKPSYRDAENLKTSIEMMDQILSLNECITERRPSLPKSNGGGGIIAKNTAQQNGHHHHHSQHSQSQSQAYALDSLLEDLASMRTQTQTAPTIRRVKFQTPNGHVLSSPTGPPQQPQQSVVALGKANAFEVTIIKDPYYDDFGFSLSDGAFEKGVYVNRIRPGGPAEGVGLKPCDHLLKVNRTDVRDLDCCMAVPLIAGAGDEIRLFVSRRTLNRRIIKGDESDEPSQIHHGIDVLESDML
ncbi:Glutamate receptor-interacting protein 2 [Hypsibius exemplaris]|uniref:Glutamate receptor-interacting protein 2 n=1 Tax=Hypsibius exemplaris TaxID=2072580 RepID=A0A1W0XAD6_HYPEX|nr:Glutamate receptor-interacting protein 2 [Hypsibius exemplaris]